MVEHHLAKVGVASSNLVFRSITFRRHSQVVRHRSATPLSPVQIRLPPPIFIITAFILFCRCGGIGRRAGLKIPYPLDVPVRPRPPVSVDEDTFRLIRSKSSRTLYIKGFVSFLYFISIRIKSVGFKPFYTFLTQEL